MNKILKGDSLKVLATLASGSIDCVITSPPYWGLRDYKAKGQLGIEKNPDEYIASLVAVCNEISRVLKPSGTFWLNLGDSYASNRKGGNQGKNTRQRSNRRFTASTIPKMGDGLKDKDLVGMPWRVAFALQACGWYLRQDIIWSKPNPMPESVRDRCTRSHEYVFMFTKSARYFYDNNAIKEPSIYGGSAERIARARIGNKRNPTSKISGIRPRDPRAGQGRITYEGKRTSEKRNFKHNGQQAFVSIPEMRNKRSVWNVTTRPFKGAHFATFPQALIEPMILAGCPQGGGRTGSVYGRGDHRSSGSTTWPAMARHRIEFLVYSHCK